MKIPIDKESVDKLRIKLDKGTNKNEYTDLLLCAFVLGLFTGLGLLAITLAITSEIFKILI